MGMKGGRIRGLEGADLRLGPVPRARRREPEPRRCGALPGVEAAAAGEGAVVVVAHEVSLAHGARAARGHEAALHPHVGAVPRLGLGLRLRAGPGLRHGRRLAGRPARQQQRQQQERAAAAQAQQPPPPARQPRARHAGSADVERPEGGLGRGRPRAATWRCRPRSRPLRGGRAARRALISPLGRRMLGNTKRAMSLEQICHFGLEKMSFGSIRARFSSGISLSSGSCLQISGTADRPQRPKLAPYSLPVISYSPLGLLFPCPLCLSPFIPCSQPLIPISNSVFPGSSLLAMRCGCMCNP